MKVNYLTYAGHAEKLQWDDYVEHHPNGTIYHSIAWKNIVEQHFSKKTHYLYVENEQQIEAVLPLVFFKSVLFGEFVVSFPYVNYGGMLYSNEQAKQMLLAAAKSLLEASNSEFIDLRSMQKDEFSLPVKAKKVTYYLSLPDSEEALMKQFKAKLRSQIRRPIKEGMYAKVFSQDGLDYFYDIFATKMRDLGTPVYNKNFFATILNELPQNSHIIIVFSQEDTPVGAAFIIHNKERMEIPWAATLRKYDRLSPNMLLYFEVLKYAMKQKCTVFDFGRCSKGSGTYRFKKQWGGEEKTLYWYYLMNKGQDLPEVNPNNPKYQIAIKIWQKLPLSLTKLMGPTIVKHIP
jgi:FemAB-related protein (PEP-CTERM system-associated)